VAALDRIASSVLPESFHLLLVLSPSQCDGARPVCHACQSRLNSKCVYDVTLDQRKPSTLRQRVEELERELNGYKTVLPLLFDALPAPVRAQFDGFAAALEYGGITDEVIEQARARLGRQRASPEDVAPTHAQQLTMLSTMPRVDGIIRPRQQEVSPLISVDPFVARVQVS